MPMRAHSYVWKRVSAWGATLALGLAVGVAAACQSGEGDDAQDPELSRCVGVCLKPLCDGAITPDADAEQRCTEACRGYFDEAEREDCDAQLQTVMACLDAASCDDFYRWLELEDGAPCVSDEQSLRDACPGIDVRSP